MSSSRGLLLCLIAVLPSVASAGPDSESWLHRFFSRDQASRAIAWRPAPVL